MSKPYIAAYLRVSTSNGRQSTQSQRASIKRYVNAHGWRSVRYLEDKVSGRTTKREAYQTLMTDARQGKVSRLIVWKMDRLGRSAIDTIRTIRELMELGVEIHIVTQGLTFDSSPYSTFLIQLFAALSELEANHIAERTRAGLSAARERGVKLGAKPNDRKRAKVAKWTEAGEPVKVIAKRLGVSVTAVYQMRYRMKSESNAA